jgi:hypothetical protein
LNVRVHVLNLAAFGEHGAFDHWEIKLLNTVAEWAEPTIALAVVVVLADQLLASRWANRLDHSSS